MKRRSVTLLLLTLVTLLLGAANVQAQDDVYFVNSGQLMRWASGGAGARGRPYRITFPAGMPRIGSIAINSRSIAYVNSGLDGDIYKTDGLTATRVYSHRGQVRQLAFGSSDDVLFFSVVETPQAPNPLADGQIYAVNLVTGRVEPRFTIAQSTVDGTWWGTFTVDRDRVYIGTFSGGIYELRGGVPALVYRNTGDQIYGLTAEVNSFFYTTGGADVYRLRRLRDRELALNVAGSQLTHVSYAPFPSSEGEPCELIVQLTGAEPGLINLFSPVVRGPNLHWLSPDLAPHGGRVATGRFRYFVLRGTYWVSMDTRGDIARAPRPREQQVDCTGARRETSFSF